MTSNLVRLLHKIPNGTQRSGVVLMELLSGLMLLTVAIVLYFVLVPASSSVFNSLLTWFNGWTPPVPFNTYGQISFPQLITNLFAEVVLGLVLIISIILLWLIILPWVKENRSQVGPVQWS